MFGGFAEDDPVAVDVVDRDFTHAIDPRYRALDDVRASRLELVHEGVQVVHPHIGVKTEFSDIQVAGDRLRISLAELDPHGTAKDHGEDGRRSEVAADREA